MLRAQAIDPKGHWSSSLGRLYAFVLLGSNSSTPLNVVRTVSLQDEHGPRLGRGAVGKNDLTAVE